MTEFFWGRGRAGGFWEMSRGQPWSFPFAFKMSLTRGHRSANGAGPSKSGATSQEIAGSQAEE